MIKQKTIRKTKHLSSEMKIVVNLTLFILIPFVIVMIVLSNLLIAQSEDDYYGKIDIIQQQASTARQDHIDNLYSITQSAMGDQALRGFLITEYSNKNWNYYSNIGQAMEKTVPLDLYKLRVFYENEKIPQGFGSFYKLSSIKNIAVIKAFLESSAIDFWITPSMVGASSDSNFFNDQYTYLSKIIIEGELVALVASSIKSSEMDKSFNPKLSQDFNGEVINSSNSYIVNNSNFRFDQSSDLNQQIESVDPNKYFIQDVALEKLPQKLIFIWERNSEKHKLYALIIILFLFMIVLIGIVIVFIRKIFDQIFESIKYLDHSIKNQLYQKIEIYDCKCRKERDGKEIIEIKKMFNELIDKIQDLMVKSVEQSTILKQSQLQALQHQINPHFMYNTLEVFAYKMEKYEHYQESDAISAFAEMLRYNITSTKKLTLLKDEISQLENYVKIQSLKYEVDFELNISEELLEQEMLRFIIQPIVENCFTHGYKGELLKIVISGIDLDSHMMIEICDNGLGMSSNHHECAGEIIMVEENSNEHIGLQNIIKRLNLFYSGDYKMEIESKVNQFTMVMITIPKKGR